METTRSSSEENNLPGCSDDPLTAERQRLARIAGQLKIGHYHRHVFLCIGENCCSAEAGSAAWECLKGELKRRNLSLAEGPQACYRTKVDCLRICTGGPILVVYPEGTWYMGMTAERIPRFVQEHLVEGRPITEWIFAVNPLPLPKSSTPTSDGSDSSSPL
jgi:(2Fe-2S) ferredoxin